MEFFLDKNIIFKYGRKIMLGHKMPFKQFKLVEEILGGRHKVYISSNTPFGTINYLKFRAMDEYGLKQKPVEADDTAKKMYKEIFGKGNWRIVNLEMSDYKKASEDKKHEWEDAVQYQCAVKCGKEFCTDNIKDFEGDKNIKLMIVR